MRRWSWSWLDRLANIAIVVLTIVAVFSVLHRYVRGTPAEHDVTVPAGSRLNLRRVDWPANKLTVVFALSTDCHFCSGNAGLYRDIVNALRLKHGGFTIAVLPQDLQRSRRYLAALNVAPDQIRQKEILSLGAKVTPTIIAVDGSGRVLKSWAGRLNDSQATAVQREITALGERLQRCKTCGSS